MTYDPDWKHGLHFLRPDHEIYHCSSCGEPGKERQGWPDSVWICDRCEEQITLRAAAGELPTTVDYDGLVWTPETWPDAIVAAHGHGQESALDDVARYLQLLAMTCVGPASVALLEAADDVRSGRWLQELTNLEREYGLAR